MLHPWRIVLEAHYVFVCLCAHGIITYYSYPHKHAYTHSRRIAHRHLNTHPPSPTTTTTSTPTTLLPSTIRREAQRGVLYFAPERITSFLLFLSANIVLEIYSWWEEEMYIYIYSGDCVGIPCALQEWVQCLYMCDASARESSSSFDKKYVGGNGENEGGHATLHGAADETWDGGMGFRREASERLTASNPETESLHLIDWRRYFSFTLRQRIRSHASTRTHSDCRHLLRMMIGNIYWVYILKIIMFIDHM